MFLSLPLPIPDAVETSDLAVRSYSATAKQNGVEIEELTRLLGSDAGCLFYHAEKKKYLIYYNDTLASAGRMRWTVAHELGHYALGHLKRDAGTLSEEQYRVLEQEADAFARELLAPTALVMYLGLIMPNFCPRILAEVFGVSLEAARNITEHTAYLVRNSLRPRGEELVLLYKPHLDTLPARFPTAEEIAEKREMEKALRLQGRSNRYIRSVLKQFGY